MISVSAGSVRRSHKGFKLAGREVGYTTFKGAFSEGARIRRVEGF